MQRLLNGMSWNALAIVAVFCALQATEWVLTPASGVVGLDASDVASAWVSRLTVFLVTAVTMLVTALVVLNAAGRAGRENYAVAVFAAVAASAVAAIIRYAIGATPAGEGAGFMLMVFMSWIGSAAILVTGYVFYLRTQATQQEARVAELRRGALETQQLATRLRLLQAQVEPHFLFNTLANVRRLYEQHHAAGRTMLENLMRYFEVALPHMRYSESTLERKSAQTRTASFPCRAIPMSGVSRRAMPPPLAAAIIAPRASRVSTRALLLRRHVAALNRDRRPRPSSRG